MGTFHIAYKICVFACVCFFFRETRACLEEMAKFQDVCPTAQSPIALFASQGIDITPNKDRGVCKASKAIYDSHSQSGFVNRSNIFIVPE